MTEAYKDITQDIATYMKKLRGYIPDVLSGFDSMCAGAEKEGALDKKTKELIALAVGVAARCDGCIGFHAQALAQLNASKEEVAETLGTAIYMGGGPSLMYAAKALRAFEEALAK